MRALTMQVKHYTEVSKRVSVPKCGVVHSCSGMLERMVRTLMGMTRYAASQQKEKCMYAQKKPAGVPWTGPGPGFSRFRDPFAVVLDRERLPRRGQRRSAARRQGPER